MTPIEIRVPQLGEGIEKVRLTRARREAGQFVARDEIIAEVQTDKANMEIECPFAGTVVAFAVADGEELRVGDVLVTLQSADGGPAMSAVEDGSPSFKVTRARQSRIGDRNMAARAAPAFAGAAYHLPPDQAVLAAHLRDSLAIATATVETELDWDAVAEARRRNFAALKPSISELICFAASRAMGDHSALRCVRTGSGYFLPERTVMGYAVGKPNDGLVIVRVPVAADADLAGFVGEMRAAQAAQRPLVDQPPSLVISDLSSFGVTGASPVVVAPSVATLFVGAPRTVALPGDDGGVAWGRRATLVLAFDHGLINGVGAAGFLQAVGDAIVGDAP